MTEKTDVLFASILFYYIQTKWMLDHLTDVMFHSDGNCFAEDGNQIVENSFFELEKKNLISAQKTDPLTYFQYRNIINTGPLKSSKGHWYDNDM